MSSRKLSALAFLFTLTLGLLLQPNSEAQQVSYDDPAAAAAVLGPGQPAAPAAPTLTPTSPQVVDCPLPLSGHVLQPASSGIYVSLGPDGTSFDLSIQGQDLFVSVREQSGLWYRGTGEIGSATQRYVVPLRAPGSSETVRYLTLCTTSIGAQCQRLNFAVTSLDAKAPSPTGAFLAQAFAWRRHNGVDCVKVMP